MLSAIVLTASLIAPTGLPYTWKNVEIVGGGFVTGIITHPKSKDLIYARTDIGGAYRWNPKTSRWIPLMDWISQKDWNLYGVESLAIDPTNPNRLYVAAGTYDNSWGQNGAILSSKNQGRTWTRFDLPTKLGGNMPGRSMGERLAVNPLKPSNVYFGTRNSGLWRSRDFGATWSRIETFPKLAPQYDKPFEGAGFDRVAPDGHGIPWVQFHGKSIIAGIARRGKAIMRSLDDGASWTPIPRQPTGLLAHQSVIGKDGMMTVVYGDEPGPNGVTTGQVWRFNLKTGDWKEITPEKPGPGNTFGYGGVTVDAKNPKVIMVSTLCRWSKGDTVFRTLDGGVTWRSLKDFSHRDASKSPFLKWGRPEADFGHWIGDVEIDPHNPNRAWYVTGATIWGTENLKLADLGKTTLWLPRAEGLEETAVLDLVSPPTGSHLVSALGDIAGFRHDDFTRSPKGGMWVNPLNNTVTDIDFVQKDPNIFVRFGNGSQQHGSFSRDGAYTWTPFPSAPAGTTGGGSGAISADGKAIVWNPEGSSPHVSFDTGATWEACVGAPKSGRILSDRKDPSAFYIQGPDRIYFSKDSGKSFQPGAQLPAGELGKMSVVFATEGHLLLPSPSGLWWSKDGGQTLQKLPGLDSCRQAGVGAPPPGARYPTIYAIGTIGDVEGIFRSTNLGENWLRINDKNTMFGTANTIIGDPRIFGRVYLGTNGRGILFADPKGAK